jgi:hypothetical protein
MTAAGTTTSYDPADNRISAGDEKVGLDAAECGDSSRRNRYTPASVPFAGYDSSHPVTDRMSRPGALPAQPSGHARER